VNTAIRVNPCVRLFSIIIYLEGELAIKTGLWRILNRRRAA